jgi:hypothetical protein
MEDALSRSSVESSSTNDDFVVVNGEPKLKITGLFNEENFNLSLTQTGDLRCRNCQPSDCGITWNYS